MRDHHVTEVDSALARAFLAAHFDPAATDVEPVGAGAWSRAFGFRRGEQELVVHLYDLAWFEFWAPWHPNLDVPLLRSALERRWREAGYAPQNLAPRLAACHLHIGLDHLAYNAHLGDWPTLAATAERMRALAAG